MKMRIRTLRRWCAARVQHLGRPFRRVFRYWQKLDSKYTWRWRAANLFAAVVITAGIVIPIAQEVWQSSRYTLSAEASQLVGSTDPSLAKQLTYDAKNKQYQFNKDAVTTGSDAGMPAELQKASVGAADKSNAKTYSLDVPEDFSKGVTYHDTNSQLSFSLVPQFDALRGKVVNGHLVFPMDGDAQAVYTLKNNGLKEDIVLPQATQDTMSFSYDLQLPSSLEARALPDHSGGIGIYSGDPSLFGDIAYGSDKDRAEVEKARANANKTYLVFGLPAPVVKDTDGKQVASARFELSGNRLSVIAQDLKSTKGAITIDPSVVVTSTTDFQTGGNNEGMIDFGTSGQITRGGLTGGTVGSWATTTSMTTTRSAGGVYDYGSAAVATNGYVYVVGLNYGSPQDLCVYTALNSNGTLGTWQDCTALTSARNNVGAVAYNGRIYIVGGNNVGTELSTVEYATIQNNGSLGSWTATTSLPVATGFLGSFAYNGYIYAVGGADNSTNAVTTTRYAPINANGAIGSWTATTSLPTARAAFTLQQYNGYVYVMGGTSNYNFSAAPYNTTYYARINTDGTLGSWQTGTALSSGIAAPMSAAYNGYLYVMGGWASSGDGGGAVSTVSYAPIYANGSIGSWRTTSSFSTARGAGVGFTYNGYVYMGLGMYGTPSQTYRNDMQYAAIDRAGKPVAFGTLTNNFTTARALSCSVAYNGYLYNIGGSTTDNDTNNVTTVQYTALNSSTGNNGSWSSTTALSTAIGSASCIAYNGYLYLLGGRDGSGGQNPTPYYIAINSNGTLGTSWTASGNSSYSGENPGLFVYGTSSGAYLYLLRGDTSFGSQYASLDASTGAIGSWTAGADNINNYQRRAFAQVGKYLYAFGGYNGSNTVYSAVEYTSINNDGSMNAWASTTSMNTAIGFTKGATVNGCIYSVGGETGAGVSMNNVQYACPAANGTISAWYNAPNLTVATTDMGVTSYNGYIYGVGGWTTSAVATTQYAYVNNGGSGSNGTWVGGANDLTGDTTFAKATSYNGYVYVVGGTDGSTEYNTVQYSQLAANGDVGAFSNDAHTFTNSRGNVGTTAYNGYLYMLGGAKNGGSTRYGDVQYAPIGSSGALSGNFASTTSFVTGTGSDTAREGMCVTAYNGYMYAIGGYDGTTSHADIRYAPINSNGTLGSWANSGNNLGAGESSPNGCFVADGYLFMVGTDSVQSALVNANGTLGTWKYTARFHTSRDAAVAVYSNGFVYLYGGCDTTSCTTNYGDTQFAPVYAGGTLGRWQHSTTSFTSYSVSIGSGVAVNGTIYLLGGTGVGVNESGTYYAPLNIISRTARYSKLVDLGNPVSISSITYNGVLPTSVSTPGVAPISFRAAGSDGVFGSVTSSSAITAGATACLPTSQNYKRYLEITILLDGSGGQAILPDASGTYANITDFTVNYITPHPNPNIRLRHGQTMQTGNLSPLDTCYP